MPAAQAELVPEPALNFAEERVVQAALELGPASMAAIARHIGKSTPTVHHHLTKSNVQAALQLRRAEEWDRTQGVLKRVQNMLRRSTRLVDAAIGRPACDSCGNLPVTIAELGAIAKLSLELWKELEDRGAGQGIPDSDLERWRKERERAIRIGRYLERRALRTTTSSG